MGGRGDERGTHSRRRNRRSPERTRHLEHGGDIGGFSTLLTLLSEHGLGFFIVHHLESNNLRFAIRQAILDRWVEMRPLYFIGVDGKGRIGFAENESGRITAMSAGSWKVVERID